MKINKIIFPIALFWIMLLINNKSICQEINNNKDDILTVVDQMPEFPKGIDSLIKYLSSQVDYPYDAKEKGIDGTVFVTFVVGKDGKINDPKILRGIGGGCDEEAIRVVKNMPNWKPGVKDGKNVNVQYNLPIRFKLIDVEKELNTTKNNINTNIKKDSLSKITHVEIMPEFPGGVDKLSRFLRENLVYPFDARENGTSGTVYVTFVVNVDGSLTNINILRGIGDGCNEEVVRIIKLMPKWVPGKLDGKEVPVQFNLPISFSLN